MRGTLRITWTPHPEQRHLQARERSVEPPPAYTYRGGMVIKMGIVTQDASTRCHIVPQLNWRCLEEWLAYQILQVNTDQASPGQRSRGQESQGPIAQK